MGLNYRTYFERVASVLGCSCCQTHISTPDGVISRQFRGQRGQAYLLESAVNIKLGQVVDRELVTGPHQVKDVSCTCCSTLLGWTYVKAYRADGKYKEGKFALERKLLMEIPN
ncbi:Yippee/Mis18 [Sporodiniella umbellata]|nr:Yippee/Mis18 [Sporodiniella umbellata]